MLLGKPCSFTTLLKNKLAMCVAWNEMCYLGESINKYEDRIMSLLRFWQTQNEIHTHRIQNPSWNRQWCIQPCVLDSPISMLAFSSSTYKLLKFRPHPWTKIEMDQLLKGLITSKVTYHTSIMFLLYQVLSHRTLWYTQFIIFKE